MSAAALRFGRDGYLGLSAGTRVVPELFDVLFIAPQKLLFPLQPVLELSDLVEHQVEVSLPKLVDFLPLFGGEVFHGHVTCHVFDVHQAPECFAHIHVLRGKRFVDEAPGPRLLVAALWRPTSNSVSFLFFFFLANHRERTHALEMSAAGAFSMTFIFPASVYTVPFSRTRGKVTTDVNIHSNAPGFQGSRLWHV